MPICRNQAIVGIFPEPIAAAIAKTYQFYNVRRSGPQKRIHLLRCISVTTQYIIRAGLKKGVIFAGFTDLIVITFRGSPEKQIKVLRSHDLSHKHNPVKRNSLAAGMITCNGNGHYVATKVQGNENAASFSQHPITNVYAT